MERRPGFFESITFLFRTPFFFFGDGEMDGWRQIFPRSASQHHKEKVLMNLCR